jgi:hypothetical protein
LAHGLKVGTLVVGKKEEEEEEKGLEEDLKKKKGEGVLSGNYLRCVLVFCCCCWCFHWRECLFYASILNNLWLLVASD